MEIDKPPAPDNAVPLDDLPELDITDAQLAAITQATRWTMGPARQISGAAHLPGVMLPTLPDRLRPARADYRSELAAEQATLPRRMRF